MFNYVSPVLIFSSKNVRTVLIIIFYMTKRRKTLKNGIMTQIVSDSFSMAIMNETPKTQLLKVISHFHGINWYRTLYVYLVTDK